MMPDSVEGGETSNGGGSGKQARAEELELASWPAYAHARAYERAMMYAHLRAYVSLAVKASGLLALLLSTVLLLGGYVQSLGKKDFFCITAITLIQAAGIFQDWENNLQYLLDFMETVMIPLLSKFFNLLFNLLRTILSPKGFSFSKITMKDMFIFYITSPVVWLLAILIWCVQLLYLFGPLGCAAISSWRIAKLNHGNNRDAEMMAALNIFYSLIIFQGTMFLVLLLPMSIYEAILASHLQSLEQLSDKWGKDAIGRYIDYISTNCRKDPLSIKGMDLIKYGAELLDSESQEDYLYGARLLSAFINKGEDVSWVLLPSRHRIQRLIDSLVISSSSRLDEACLQLKSQSRRGTCYAVIGSPDDKKEIRELVATIVAHVAAHIDDLTKYPGAMRCISSLFQDREETTQTYRRNSKHVPHDPLQHQQDQYEFVQRMISKPEDPRMNLMMKQQRMAIREHRHRNKREGGTSNKLVQQGLTILERPEDPRMNLMMKQQRMAIREHRHRNKREGGTSNKLVQQGLTILERLASNNDDNRRIICRAPGLLPKITAPLFSETLIEDIKTKAWADIVTRCLKVLHQLIRAPEGWTSRRLRQEISSDNQAMSNLKSILDQGNEAEHQELKLRAMEILTEMALDPSISLTKEIKKVLVIKQLQLFLPANGDDEESATIAGRALVSLSTKSESYSALIMNAQNDITGPRLTEILDKNNNITQRTIVAEIMANLCAHCNVDNNMKEILPEVLRKIMSIKTKSQQRKISAGQNNSALGDEENQGNSVSTNNEESTEGDQTEIKEISDQEREEQEAFLSLAQVICDKLDSADLDGAIQNALQNEKNAGSEEQRREAFVDKLKTIIDGNCHPAADSLRIVKLCGQIAKSVMGCEQYVEIFRNRGFKSSLSNASITMCELETCMLFVGTDFGLRKAVKPLLSELEKTWSEM